eukprot:5536418-Pleurochrysis_carterae.AAC.1
MAVAAAAVAAAAAAAAAMAVAAAAVASALTLCLERHSEQLDGDVVIALEGAQPCELTHVLRAVLRHLAPRRHLRAPKRREKTARKDGAR